jgi:hypothetical protein
VAVGLSAISFSANLPALETLYKKKDVASIPNARCLSTVQDNF